jgi:glycosyltransferase involved in cell wall biosynthesis
MAPVQGWLAMKYHACEIDEIDARFAVENVVLTKRMDGHDWRTFGSAAASWLDPALEVPARELRAGFPADAVVAASIGREEKLDSPPFLEAVCTLLQRHPRLHFVWTGRVQRPSIQGAFERAGVAARTRFAGWVDTRLYAQAIDLFLDSFPFPCGFTLKEAMAAGKPAVMMSTPESLETGVPGAISPLVDGSGAAAPEARERLRAIFTAERDFDLYRCAGSPDEYVAMAGALVADAGLRSRVGSANRAFIEAFLSSPAAEARKFLAHLDAIFETIPTT